MFLDSFRVPKQPATCFRLFLASQQPTSLRGLSRGASFGQPRLHRPRAASFLELPQRGGRGVLSVFGVTPKLLLWARHEKWNDLRKEPSNLWMFGSPQLRPSQDPDSVIPRLSHQQAERQHFLGSIRQTQRPGYDKR